MEFELRSRAAIAAVAGEDMAFVLRRISLKLEGFLDEAKELASRLAKTPSGPQREKLVAQYKEARKGAEEQLLFLRIQRESMGFTEHKYIDEMYPMPPPIS